MANLMPFAGKVVTVTGAAHGIGLATVNYLVSRGATVSMADRDMHALQQAEEILKKNFPDANVTHLALDVRDRKSVQGWIESTKETFGKIDCCVNNAGKQLFQVVTFVHIWFGLVGVVGHEYKPISDVSDHDWNYVLDVNLKGVLNCLRAELPLIEDNGSIVDVAGVAGQIGIADMSPYVASKHGVIGLTKCAAKEVAERGVRVNTVCP